MLSAFAYIVKYARSVEDENEGFKWINTKTKRRVDNKRRRKYMESDLKCTAFATCEDGFNQGLVRPISIGE